MSLKSVEEKYGFKPISLSIVKQDQALQDRIVALRLSGKTWLEIAKELNKEYRLYKNTQYWKWTPEEPKFHISSTNVMSWIYQVRAEVKKEDFIKKIKSLENDLKVTKNLLTQYQAHCTCGIKFK